MRRSLARFVAVTSGVRDVLPRVVAANISADGLELYLIFNEQVTAGVDGYTDFAMTASGGAVTLTYVSGDGATTWTYSLSRELDYDETVTLDYTQPGAGLKDYTDNLLATFVETGVTNGSLVGVPDNLVNLDRADITLDNSDVTLATESYP